MSDVSQNPLVYLSGICCYCLCYCCICVICILLIFGGLFGTVFGVSHEARKAVESQPGAAEGISSAVSAKYSASPGAK